MSRRVRKAALFSLTVGVTGLAGFIVLALVNAGLFFYDRVLATVPVSECRLR